jgi:amino acid adenylation domain-containing protein
MGGEPIAVGAVRVLTDLPPLSFSQERLWFLEQLAPGTSAHHLGFPMHLRGRLDVPALEAAIDDLLQRHESLRTSFPAVRDLPGQRVHPHRPYTLAVEDLGGLPEAGRWAAAVDRVRAVMERPFDLSGAPPVRFLLLRLAGEEHVLAGCVHHIAADARSVGILLRDLSALYAAHLAGGWSEPAEPGVRFVDHAARQRRALEPELEDLEAYWRRELAAAPVAAHLAGRRVREGAAPAGRHAFRVGAELVDRLAELGARERASTFMALLAGFELLLHRYTGRDDVLVGVPVSGRDQADLEDVVGCFVNTLVMRSRLPAGMSLRELLRATRSTALDAFEHRDLPFDLLVRELQPERQAGQMPFVAVLFNLIDRPGDALRLPGLEVGTFPSPVGAAIVDLSVELMPVGRELAGEIEYRVDAFEASEVARLAEHYVRLLTELVADPDRPGWRVTFLDAAEVERLACWGWGGPAVGGGETVVDLLEAQRRRSPEAVAVLEGERCLSYRELHRRADLVAVRLAAAGAGPEDVVAVCGPRSVEQVIAMLGVLKAGAAYLPLDPELPPARLGAMAARGGARVLLAAAGLLELVPGDELIRLAIESAGSEEAGPGADPAGARARGLAYLMCTSGSTGEPKAVMVEHAAVANHLGWMREAHPLGPSDLVMHKSPCGFDVSIYEVLWPLTAGVPVVVAGPGAHRDALQLAAEIGRAGVTVLDLVPSMLAALVTTADPRLLASLRLVVCGGEALTPDLLARAETVLGASVCNHYGPTETTIDASHHPCVPGEQGPTVAIDEPVAGVRLAVLDRELQLVPRGVPGELCVGGTALARGYAGRPDLTAERFLPDPFPTAAGDRLYRTGDLVRRREDGALEYVGRIDAQVKVRGQRVEPGEIEAALEAHPEVRRAAVTSRGTDGGESRLVAYVAAEASVGDGLPARLRAHLAGRLPASMVPAAYVVLPELPLTPSGKVDRAALPAPGADSLAVAAGSRPASTPAEERLAELWEELLGVRPAAGDNFFHLGGHSLLAIQLLSRIQDRLGAAIAVRTVFERPRLEDLAAEVERGALRPAGLAPVEPVARDGPLPLSHAQRGMWFLAQLAPELPVYNLATARRLRAGVETELVDRCLSALVRRHEALRSVVVAEGGEPAQVVRPPALGVLREVSAAGDAAARRVMSDEARRPFDLSAGPLFRATLVRLEGGESVLVLVMHHIVADGWSTDVVWRELAALVRAGGGAEPALPALRVQQADYAAWERAHLAGEAGQGQLRSWRERLAGAPAVLELPQARRRRSAQGFRGAHAPVRLPDALVGAVAEAARREGVTVFMLLLAAYQALLYRYTGQDDIVIGVPVANRDRGELKDVVGLLANTLPIRAWLHGAMTARELLAAVRETALDAFTHQDVPFDRLVDDLGLPRDGSHSPLAQVMFTFEDSGPRGTGGEDPFQGQAFSIATGTAKFDLTLFLRRDEGGIAGSCEYSLDLFDEAVIERLAARYETLLAAMAAAPETRLNELPMVSDEEFDRVVRRWNAAPAGSPRDHCLHQLVAEQASRTPGAAAVLQDGVASLTYAELDRAADALAARLAGLGFGPGAVVAVCVPRSPELVAALLGVWRSGATCLPLDPDHPVHRLGLAIEDARPAAFVVCGRPPAGLPVGRAPVVALDGDWCRSDPGAGWAAAADPLGVAAILHTSGSTGRPRGVVLAHGGLADVVHDRNVAHRVTAADRVLSNFSVAFDPTLWQLLGPLLVGAAVVLPAPGRHGDLAYTLELVRRADVTIVDTTPALLAALLDEPGARAGFEHVRTVFCGGEPLPADLVARFDAEIGAELVNIYGITETSIDVTRWRCRPDPLLRRAPIGRPAAGKRVYVLDPAMRPAPPGVPGEMYVGGSGVALGYLDRPELTAERFLPDPFSGEPGARLFRTGDFARHLPDECLEFMGRRDDMVKLRGYRVELGEIEQSLREHPGVAAAAVVPSAGAGPDGALVAHFVAESSPPPSARELSAHLRERLPAYMVPARFLPIDVLPRTVTGKVDRAALPRPPVEPRPQETGASPTEAAIAAIWRELLEVDEVGVSDDFFKLGGHSMSAVRMLARVQEALGVQIAVRVLLADPTIANLTAAVERTRAGPVSAPP